MQILLSLRETLNTRKKKLSRKREGRLEQNKLWSLLDLSRRFLMLALNLNPRHTRIVRTQCWQEWRATFLCKFSNNFKKPKQKWERKWSRMQRLRKNGLQIINNPGRNISKLKSTKTTSNGLQNWRPNKLHSTSWLLRSRSRSKKQRNYIKKPLFSRWLRLQLPHLHPS